MRIHRSELYHMRGSGIGTIFSTLFRSLIPIAQTIFGATKKAASSPLGRKILKSTKRHAVDAGLEVAQDALDGENVIQAAKKRGKVAAEKTLMDLSKIESKTKKKNVKKPTLKTKAKIGKGSGTNLTMKKLLTELGIPG